MTNGCICCTLRDDLLAEVRSLAEEGRSPEAWTHLADPLPAWTPRA